MREAVPVAAVAGLWIAAGLNLGLLFDLKATTTTLAALLVATALVLPASARPAAAVAVPAPAVVFAAAVVHPLAAVAVMVPALAILARLLRGTGLGAGRRWTVAAGVAAAFWPALLGLVSNSVVEVACPEGGVDEACYGFWRVGTT
jgi:hypothetical protein